VERSVAAAQGHANQGISADNRRLLVLVPCTRDEAGTELLGDDYSQPDTANGEPVFWSASDGPDFPTDDCLQPDLSACSAQADAPDCAE